MTPEIILPRIVGTFVLAFIFGYERQRSRKPIGFGTFIFVATGACSLALTALNLNYQNPLPLLSAIVTGIGFLGAGALFRTEDRIYGFTSAATIWIFAAVGLLIGVGEYMLGATVYASVWVVTLVDRWLDRPGFGVYEHKLVVQANKIIDENVVRTDLLTGIGCKLQRIEASKSGSKFTLVYMIENMNGLMAHLARGIQEYDWFEAYTIE